MDVLEVARALEEKESAKVEKEAQERAAKFRALVVGAAMGETKLNAGSLAAKLADCQTTPAAFAEAVEEERRRQGLRALAGEVEDRQAAYRLACEATVTLQARHDEEIRESMKRRHGEYLDGAEAVRLAQVALNTAKAAAEELRALGEPGAEWIDRARLRDVERAKSEMAQYVASHVEAELVRLRGAGLVDPEIPHEHAFRARREREWRADHPKQAALLAEAGEASHDQ